MYHNVYWMDKHRIPFFNQKKYTKPSEDLIYNFMNKEKLQDRNLRWIKTEREK